MGSRIQENLSILTRRQAENESVGWEPIKAEIHGLRIGEFVLITFPGEALIEVALNVKKMSPHKYTFVLGHTNSTRNNYLYSPVAEQYNSEAYEDVNTSLAPEWQRIFEEKVKEILGKL